MRITYFVAVTCTGTKTKYLHCFDDVLFCNCVILRKILHFSLMEKIINSPVKFGTDLICVDNCILAYLHSALI